MDIDKLLHDALVIWATIDPIGTLAIFTGLTGGLDMVQRRRTAIRAVTEVFGFRSMKFAENGDEGKLAETALAILSLTTNKDAAVVRTWTGLDHSA